VPLAEAMATILGDPAQAESMGRLGREIVVERFSARAMVRQMEDLYTHLLRERGAGAPARAPIEAAH
jgi:glycosyltransferase involved in cell wall biosynthesis